MNGMTSDFAEVQRYIDLKNLEQTVFREARLLDNELLLEWLDMTTEDVIYQMALTGRKFRKDRSAPLQVGDGYIFNEDRARLKLRIDRLLSGFVWAEDPPNFARRIVSNVEILAGERAGEATVHSVITIHRNRIDSQTRTFVAGRKDCWRKVDGAWRLARRDISLDHSVVPDTNVNVFF